MRGDKDVVRASTQRLLQLVQGGRAEQLRWEGVVLLVVVVVRGVCGVVDVALLLQEWARPPLGQQARAHLRADDALRNGQIDLPVLRGHFKFAAAG